MKKIFLSIFLLLVFIINIRVKALSYGGCEYSEISELKSFVSNINLSYDYYILNNEAYFNITISNLVPDVYFIESSNNRNYNYSDAYDGEIIIRDIKQNSGTLKFYSARSECYGVKLSDKYYKLPIYNKYYEDPLCKEYKNYNICQKWVNVNYSYEEFKNMIDKYNSNNDDDITYEPDVEYKKTLLEELLELYVKYYYFILPLVILVCISIMSIIKKRNRFDL